MFSRETLTLEFQKVSNAQAEHYSTQTCCICADVIVDFVPEFFMGEEVNAACDMCKEASNAFDDDTADSSAKGQNIKKPDLKLDPDPNSMDENSNAAPKESSIVETKSCEEKDPVIEAKDNEIIKDFLAKYSEQIKARIGT